jgi:UDP-N-acetyl-2-amino-2-deoxyglucuronate dehydrogenase
MGELGFGLIGCGVISAHHCKALSLAKGAKLVAACDIVKEKAEKVGVQYGVENVYTDYREMLKRDDIHVVSICTPSGTHSQIAVEVARAGKHILCEKPLDIKLDRIDAMIAAAEEAGVKLGGIFQRRTYASSIAVRDAVQSGVLGKMVLGDGFFKYYRNQAYYDSGDWRGTWELDGGGSLMNQGVHGIDLLTWIMGEVESVQALCGTLARDIEVEDTAVALLKFKNGAFGVMEGTTTVYPARPTRLEFHGEKGTIVLEEQTIKEWKTLDGAVPPDLASETVGGAGDAKAISGIGHVRLVQDMIDAINEDREPYIPGREGRKAVEVILAIYKSQKEGRPVYIEELR